MKNLDWRRMGLFVTGTFLVNLSIAGLSHQPLWPAVKDAFWQAALFAGGFCQNPAKVGGG
ncbi:MAG TPA: hypothetical protein VFA07_04655 [Chthonomonadaceae bacterium]|nr:hypothetical protein [Chthonomonadaceae bacterium]